MLIQKIQTHAESKYQAPEISIGEFDAFASDIWSAGVVLFALLAGITPFKTAKASDPVLKLVSRGNLRLAIESWDIPMSEEACDLLQNMLWRKPEERLNLFEILEHPWLVGESTPMKSKRTTIGVRAIPTRYFGLQMDLLRQEIQQHGRKSEPFMNRSSPSRLSLRRELLLRTEPRSRRVRFGAVETLVYEPAQTPMACPCPEYEQSKARVSPKKRIPRLKRLLKSARKTLRVVIGDRSKGEPNHPAPILARSA